MLKSVNQLNFRSDVYTKQNIERVYTFSERGYTTALPIPDDVKLELSDLIDADGMYAEYLKRKIAGAEPATKQHAPVDQSAPTDGVEPLTNAHTVPPVSQPASAGEVRPTKSDAAADLFARAELEDPWEPSAVSTPRNGFV